MIRRNIGLHLSWFTFSQPPRFDGCCHVFVVLRIQICICSRCCLNCYRILEAISLSLAVNPCDRYWDASKSDFLLVSDPFQGWLYQASIGPTVGQTSRSLSATWRSFRRNNQLHQRLHKWVDMYTLVLGIQWLHITSAAFIVIFCLTSCFRETRRSCATNQAWASEKSPRPLLRNTNLQKWVGPCSSWPPLLFRQQAVESICFERWIMNIWRFRWGISCSCDLWSHR